ncbi:rhodanese-like domain protein [Oceanicola granulosus HTCC2516]|uniref:tRNA uridine(34) hydroxylase n=1 Tax=Oceanicola granulosus (strain ATCC BAA-861 / DSM 15982 / KCTC 12143 / HTCC2516) TaxID=314256 RepID=Q2CD70_OCEGH|nr:rhodanese-related sulfurtransferase [Oceanicola granulosus]EAR50608.1 rhodanese-like domain protein [Oceanicola granulosus HTCC2516]
MFTVAALYKFTPFADPAGIREPLRAACAAAGVRGTLLLAPEGINGTIAGRAEGITAALAHIRALPGCADLEPKVSHAAEMPFGKLKVRLKREIVTMGRPDVAPREGTGRYVAPAEWNALISAPDVAVIDTRNDYEVAIGSFEGAEDPRTAAFGDFPAWWEQNRERFAGKRIAMFCTGGIRCEKSTNYLMSQGVEEVFHLEGGILKYLEEVPEERSLWHGSCFVFDGRVSVGHGLSEGPHVLCHACRRPILPEDRARAEYEEGVACHHCAHQTSDADKARFRERQRQIALARARGERHLG